MKRVLIAGFTGMIGNLILENCVHNEEVTDVITVVKKATNQRDF